MCKHLSDIVLIILTVERGNNERSSADVIAIKGVFNGEIALLLLLLLVLVLVLSDGVAVVAGDVTVTAGMMIFAHDIGPSLYVATSSTLFRDGA